MGQFASSISLSIAEILILTESNVTAPEKAIYDLDLITIALEPRTMTSPFPPPPPSDGALPLELAIFDALDATYSQSVFIFNSVFKSISPTAVNTSYGTVLNYAPVAGNYDSLTNQIAACFSAWGLQPGLAADVAAQLQPQVVLSANTPLATYGRTATGNVVINDPYINVEFLFWVAAFGIFQTGINFAGDPTYAVIYSFSAANGIVQTTI